MEANDLGNVTFTSIKDEGFVFYASPQFWLGKAAELNLAANVLYEKSLQLCSQREHFLQEKVINNMKIFPNDPRFSGCIWQTMMMAGFALENVFKAIIIKNYPEKISNGKLDKIRHDLIKLSKEANILLSDLELRLCEICYHAIICEGRYPISKNADKIASTWHVNIETSWSVYNCLFNKLINIEYTD